MVLATTPSQMSFEDYLAHDDGTDKRYELVDGVLVAMNPPTFRHMLMAKFIEQQFEIEIKRLQQNWICFREAGIRTGVRKSRLTDVYVVTRDQISNILDSSAICQTAPLLVVEVVSPDSVKRDYRYKRAEYAALEVSEYWIVDSLDQQVTVLLFNEGLYDEAVFRGDERIQSATFPELKMTAAEVLTAGSLPEQE